MLRAGAMAFLASDIELNISGFISIFHLFQLEAGIMTARAAHLKRFFNGGCLEAAVFLVPVLTVVWNPSRGRLVPLKGEDIMVVPDLDLVTLFPAPSSERPRHVVSDFFGEVFPIH